MMILPSLVAAMALGSPPPRVVGTIQDHANPTQRRVETSYTCGGGERRFTLVYDERVRASLVSAVRLGVALPPDQLAQVNRAIRGLDSLTSITPQCSEPHDMLIAVGVVGEQRSAVFVSWFGAEMRATAAQPIGF